MLENSLPIYCGGICSSYGVLFEMQGASAFTDYSKVVIPELDITNNKVVTLGTGYVVHECGHIASTNPDSKKVFFNDSGKVEQPLALSFYRAIEDVRMERDQWSRLQGAKRILNNLVTALCEQESFMPILEADEPGVVLQKFVLYYARGYVGQQQSLFDYIDDASPYIDASIPSGILVKFKALLSSISTLKNTDDSVALAIRLAECIDEELNSDDPDDSSQQSDESQGNAQSQDSDDSQQSTIKSNLKNNLRDYSESDLIDSDVGDLVQEVLEKESKSSNSNSVPVAKLHSYPGSADSSIAKEANALSNVLRARLLNYLEEQSDISFSHSDEGDDFDDTRLSELMLGETDVYLNRTHTEFTYDTSVHILLDRSGSMGSIIHKACVSTLGIALTLNQVDGVSCSATAFPSGAHDVLLLSDGSDVRNQTQRFNIPVSGSTPMASAMWQALQMLYSTDKKRLILIVVTDGSPDYDQSSATKSLISQCLQSDIELLGIGLGGSTNVSTLFPNSVEVDSVSDLAPALFSELQKLMEIRSL